ncbi:MAG: NAD(P)/FAD-dependent oxidoreductase [Myxococcales bacterium]|nr:NAD(P)/FAD-dependent oxidoreductase [Myxococcales bacterium]
MQSLDIAVVGTGTAGSASALFLARAGHRVTVYERVLDPQPIGAGIMLQPTGMAVLAALGLVNEVVARGEPLTHLVAQTPSGRSVLDLAYADLAPDLYGVGLHRGVLFASLFKAVQSEPRVTLKLGLDIEDLTVDAGGHWLVEKETRRRFGPHDLVIVCNGARSSLRDDTSHHKVVRRYPWGALWAVVPDVEHRYRQRLFQVVRGTRVLIGMLPSGLGPSGTTPQVSLFYSLRADRLEEHRASDFSKWKASVLADAPAAAPVLEHLRSHDDLLFSEYHDVVMWPWNVGRVVYLGDSAHAMSPQLGQGANLALVDAAMLAQAFENTETVDDALFRYSRTRRGHLAWYQFVTRWLTPFFQSDLPPLAVARDLLFGTACKVSLFRSEMVAMMAGISLGPFRRMGLSSRPPPLLPTR